MRFLLTFEKGEAVRWLGHLDVLRAFERAVRRSGLPVAFSAGFNPRERLAFASALGVGVTGGSEKAAIELADDASSEKVVTALNAALPPGFRVLEAERIPDEGARDLLNRYRCADFLLTCDCPGTIDSAQVRAASDRLLDQSKWPVERSKDGKIRRIDLRPFVLSIVPGEVEAGTVTFQVEIAMRQDGAARPAEIAALLSGELSGLALRRAHRVRLREVEL